MVGYYDVILGIIPVTLIGITALLHVMGFSLTTAVPFGAVVAAGFIGHALFVNAPVTSDPVESPRPSFQAAD